MTTKQKFGLDSIKKGIMRTKQKVVETFSKGEKTVDPEFNQAWQEFKQYEVVIEKLKKVEVQYLASMRKLLETEVKLETDCANALSNSNGGLDNINSIKELLNRIEEHRQEMENNIQRDFLEPMTLYMRQIGLIKQRHEERERRLIDMDRYHHDYKVGLEKSNNDKANSNKKKYNGMRNAYNSLNEELKRDIPLLIRDKDHFFAPLFATHVRATSEFYRNASELMDQAYNYLMHINKEEIHTFGHLITSEEESCWNKQIDLAAQVSEYDMENPSSSSSTTSSYSSNTTSNNNSVQRPPPVRQNNNVKRAKALYDFVGQSETELSFRVGDVLNLVDAQEGADWWTDRKSVV